MAYFSNGSEGMAFDNECSECIYGKDPCPIAFVQMHYNYDACNNETATAILGKLVRQDKDFTYKGCAMKELIDKKAEAK